METQSGFRANAAGLLVPEELSRERQVWTKDEGRLLDRVAKLLTSRGMLFQLACVKCRTKKPLERIRQANGDYVLRCDHMDREFQKGL